MSWSVVGPEGWPRLIAIAVSNAGAVMIGDRQSRELAGGSEPEALRMGNRVNCGGGSIPAVRWPRECRAKAVSETIRTSARGSLASSEAPSQKAVRSFVFSCVERGRALRPALNHATVLT